MKTSYFSQTITRISNTFYSEASSLAACWGILLTSVTFITLVVSPGDFEASPDHQQHVTLRVFCLAFILALGCIQSVFSFIVCLASLKRRAALNAIWLGVHLLVAIFLGIFLIINAFHRGSFISEDHKSHVTTLDIVILFDLFFLLLVTVSMTWGDSAIRNRSNLAAENASESTLELQRAEENQYEVLYAYGLSNPVLDINENVFYSEPMTRHSAARQANPAEHVYENPYEMVWNIPVEQSQVKIQNNIAYLHRY